MKKDEFANIDIPAELLEAIKSFPLRRKVEHCGKTFLVPPFDIYATCPQCMTRIKVRSFSAQTEIEDVFDAVFEWVSQLDALMLMQARQKNIKEDANDS
jgi:hypothetical protein